jgi:hypothetical protein
MPDVSLAIARPKGTVQKSRKVYAFWAYDITDSESLDDRKYIYNTRQEAEIAKAEIGGTTIQEEWVTEYV